MTLSTMNLLDGYSVEMTGKDISDLHDAQHFLPAGTRVNVTFLGNENLEMRLAAAEAVKNDGLVPVPHLSARRLASTAELEEFVNDLRESGCSDHLFAIAGDPPHPLGPYADALALISAEPSLASFGVKTISISGYPEGHPEISTEKLWTALEDKAAALHTQGLSGDILTQFGFNVDPVIDWIEAVRSRGIDLPIRVGVPGPAGIRRLLAFAARFGVSSSAGIAKKYGFSLTNLLGTAGPDRFITELASRLDADRHGDIKLHFYTFGGLRATAQWVQEFAAKPQKSISGTSA